MADSEMEHPASESFGEKFLLKNCLTPGVCFRIICPEAIIDAERAKEGFVAEPESAGNRNFFYPEIRYLRPVITVIQEVNHPDIIKPDEPPLSQIMKMIHAQFG